jgi:lipopolysaccharide transport system permease protein
MNNQLYTEIIRPKKSLFDLRLIQVWDYRDLLFMFVRRDFVAGYKQTILGPLWFFVQPIFTTIMFTFVFGNIAQISTDGQPKTLFYLSGLTIWNYFSECFTKTSNIFIANAGIFGKVYFPRLISPLSIVVSGLMKFVVQFLMFLIFLFYYTINGEATVNPNSTILLLPILILMMAGFALGFGMIVSSMTTKYRDLIMLISFGVTLLMYATPIIYPVSSIPDNYKSFVMANPLAPIVETFRFAFLGSGQLDWNALGYSFLIMSALLTIGVIVFNKVEQTFMDTV